MTTRDCAYDKIKGMAICLMVLLHAMEPSFPGVARWIGIFHIPVFFIAVGWFYKKRDSDNVDSCYRFVRKRIVRLWWPFVFWGVVFVLLHDVFLNVGVYSYDPEVVGRWYSRGMNSDWGLDKTFKRALSVVLFGEGIGGMGGAFWFLKILFFASVFYCFSDWIVRKIGRVWNRFPTRFVLLTLFALVALVCSRYFYHGKWWGRLQYLGGARMLTAYGLIHFGVVLRAMGFQLSNRSRKELLLVSVLCGAVVTGASCLGHVSLAQNHYESVCLLLIGSAAGWYLLEAVSRIFWGAFARCLAYVGRNTMPILLFHFLAFKVVSAVGVWLNGMPYRWIGAFPTTFQGGEWCLAYLFVGVAIPLLLSYLWNAFKDKFGLKGSWL